MSIKLLNNPLNDGMNFVKTSSWGIENIHDYCTL
jgi:hypothetical protein